MTDQIAIVERGNYELTQSLGRIPSIRELASHIEMEEKRVVDLMGWHLDPLSLETPVREDREDDGRSSRDYGSDGAGCC